MSSSPDVLWSERAVQDRLDIAKYIAADDRGAAARWLVSVLESVESAAQFPRSGRRVPELLGSDIEFREMIRGTYRIVYQLDDTPITIVTIFEGHRRLETTLGEND